MCILNFDNSRYSFIQCQSHVETFFFFPKELLHLKDLFFQRIISHDLLKKHINYLFKAFYYYYFFLILTSVIEVHLNHL